MPGEIDKLLVASVKAARGGKPMQFAFVPKGQEGKLLVAKKIAPKQVAEAKKDLGGTVVFRGRCVGEDGTLRGSTSPSWAACGVPAGRSNRVIGRGSGGACYRPQFLSDATGCKLSVHGGRHPVAERR